MSLAHDLLEQARHLARRERSRPRQASLRRSISGAYYALFHLLVEDATRLVATPPGVRDALARAFDHGEMKEASKSFGGGTLPPALSPILGGATPSVDLRLVAEAFVDLQQARHEADYDVARRFTRREAQNYVVLAETAFTAWRRVRSQAEAKAYLVALLVWRKWRR